MNWMAHIIRIPDDDVVKKVDKIQEIYVKKILQLKVTGIRKRRRPRLRWTDSVESDFTTINEKTWRTKVNERSLWRRLQRKGLPDIYDDEIYHSI
ncbi:hypothetical protein TNCV_3416931 [Trichonephila clavipes]|nr:hypothetical protein TNCV_3416931 [Trichonephila clavipes]